MSASGLFLDEDNESRPNLLESMSSSNSSHHSNQTLEVTVKTYVRNDTKTSENGSTASLDSRSKRRQQKLLENSNSIVDDNAMDDTCQPASVSSDRYPPKKEIVVSQKWQGKPLPGFIKLAPGAPRHELVMRTDKIMKDSINDIAVVNSAHTMLASTNKHAQAMKLRRGATDAAMDEPRRATSPVSGFREQNNIQGFREPPRDYMQKLTPIDQRLILKRYGYGSSPKKKGEMLHKTLQDRYKDSDLLNSKNDSADILKRIALASREKLHERGPDNNQQKHQDGNPDNAITIRTGIGGFGTDYSGGGNYGDGGGIEDFLGDPSLSNLSEGLSLLDAASNNLGNMTYSKSHSKKSLEKPSVPPGMMVSLDENNAIDITDTTNACMSTGVSNVILPTLDSVCRDVSPEVPRGAAAKMQQAEEIADYTVLSAGKYTTGLALSKGQGYQSKSAKKNNNKKITPAERRRMKIAAEKAAAGTEGRQPLVIKEASPSKLDTIRLKNNTDRSALSADPRPGALPPSNLPYYDPGTYRQPVTLEDKLRNMPEVSEDVDLLSFATLDEYSTTDASATMQDQDGNSLKSLDPESWRKEFLSKRIKWPDAIDSDSDDGTGAFGVDDAPDNFDFNAALSPEKPDDDEEEEDDEGGHGIPAGMKQVVVAEAVPATFDADGKELIPAVEAVYELVSMTVPPTPSDAGSIGSRPTTDGVSRPGTDNGEQMNDSRPITGVNEEGALAPLGIPNNADPTNIPSATSSLTGPVSNVRSSANSVMSGTDGDYQIVGPSGDGKNAFPGSEPNAATIVGNPAAMGIGSPGGLVADDRISTASDGNTALNLARASLDGPAAPLPNSHSHAPTENNSQAASGVGDILASSNSSVDSSQLGFGSDASSAHLHSTNTAELEEQRKEKKKEAHRKFLRARKLAELEEEAAQKQALFIANHVDPATAKRVDYKFPEHGIQQPGVGEDYTRYRDYADDSMFIGYEGVVMTQKDQLNSTLLDTVLMDVRLRSPAYGDQDARPMSPWEREAAATRGSEKMFNMLLSSSQPQTPDLSHRKILHQIVIMQEQQRKNVQLQAETQTGYGKWAEDLVEEIPSSQRFRMEAEEQRKIQEQENMVKEQARLDANAEKNRLALEKAGVKAPRRKKLQPKKQQATTEVIPIAYAVGGKSKSVGGVGCSVVSTHPPSLVHKPKKQYTHEFKPPEQMYKVALIPAKQRDQPFRSPEIKISRGVTVMTRDNTVFDPTLPPKSNGHNDSNSHQLWTPSIENERGELADVLEKHNQLTKAGVKPGSPGSNPGSRKTLQRSNSGNSRGSKGSAANTRNAQQRPNSKLGIRPGSPGSVQVEPPSPGKLAAESTLTLNSNA